MVLTHVVVMKFVDSNDAPKAKELQDELLGRQSHEAHLSVGGWLRPRLASRTVVDF